MIEVDTYNALHEVFRNVLEDESITLTPATTAEDVNGWDSQKVARRG